MTASVTRGMENEESAKIRKNCISCERRKKASTNRSTIEERPEQNMENSLRH